MPDGTAFFAPLNWPGIAHKDVFHAYEPDAIEKMAEAIKQAKSRVSFVDCGADIGAYTRLLLVYADNIDFVTCIEPNAASTEFLERNLSQTKVESRVILSAVSNFEGFGELVAPEGSNSNHAYFLQPSEAPTDLKVLMIDQLDLGTAKTIAMKIDVEGEEFNVLQGATQTLRNADQFILQIEVHPDVCRRVGFEPLELIQFLNEMKPCKVWACIEKTREVFEVWDFKTSFFEQFDETQIHDLVIVSGDH